MRQAVYKIAPFLKAALRLNGQAGEYSLVLADGNRKRIPDKVAEVGIRKPLRLRHGNKKKTAANRESDRHRAKQSTDRKMWRLQLLACPCEGEQRTATHKPTKARCESASRHGLAHVRYEQSNAPCNAESHAACPDQPTEADRRFIVADTIELTDDDVKGQANQKRPDATSLQHPAKRPAEVVDDRHEQQEPVEWKTAPQRKKNGDKKNHGQAACDASAPPAAGKKHTHHHRKQRAEGYGRAVEYRRPESKPRPSHERIDKTK